MKRWDLLPWCLPSSCLGGFPAVSFFDVTGGGATNAAGFWVGATFASNGTYQGGGIYQNFTHTGGDLVVSMDVASFISAGNSNVDGGQFSLFIDGDLIDFHDVGGIGEAFVSVTQRATLGGEISNLAAGTYEFRLLAQRRFGSNATSPRQFFDNASAVAVAAVPEPSSLAVFGIGALVAGGFRSRRKR